MSLLARIRTSHRAAARHTHNYPRLPHTRSKAGALVLGHSLAHRSASLSVYGKARYGHGNSAEANAALTVVPEKYFSTIWDYLKISHIYQHSVH